MILDERNEFADAVSVAAVAGTALIGDVIDLQGTGIDLGLASDDNLYLVIQVDTEVITAGAAGTIEFQLVSDAQAAIATDGSATKHYSSGALVTGAAGANDNKLNAGGLVAAVRLPMGDYERYIGILCVIGTTTVTAGKINAFLTPNVGKVKVYPEGMN